MAEKKMTQVEALEIAVAVLPEGEAKDVLTAMVEKRKAPRKPRTNKEAEAFRATLVEFLQNAEGPLTNAELAEALEVKPQKVANNLRVLVKAGTVTRIESEKKSDKATFVLA